MRQLQSFIFGALALAVLAYWLWQGRPHQYPDAPTGQFACLSYTPRSSGPDVHRQIERDLQQLAQRTRCVRTYSVLNGLDHVPEVARKLGLRVLLGIWISRDALTNEKEIAKATMLARSHRDVIDAIIVGNEVLLRREQTVTALHALLQRVRAATHLPVTYADVWDFWLKNPQLGSAADFITIHILPYWDDQPIGVDHAMAHVMNIYRKAQGMFPGKQIYIGETGWPSAGRQRESATPSLINQARFTRDFIALASTQKIPYNFIEAYDQPWKKGLEGTVGGYWGLYDVQGHEKFPLTGAVIADATWWRGPLAGALLALLLWGVTRRVEENAAALSSLSAALAGFCLGGIGVLQWDYLWQSNRDWQEWLAMSGFMLIGALLFLLHLLQPRRYLRWAGPLLLAFLFCLAYINLGLTFNPRYRDFPSVFVVLPVAALLLNHWRERLVLNAEATLLCAWLVLSSIAIAINEQFTNGSAWCWCALCALLGFGLLCPRRLTGPSRAAHQP